MTVREHVTELLLGGNAPDGIAKTLGKGMDEIRRHLLYQVGERRLRYSDILYSIHTEIINKFENVYRRYMERGINVSQSCRARGLDPYYYDLWFICREGAKGDTYALLSEIEIMLHQNVKRALQLKLGPDESKWWRVGVPQKVRAACAARREKDDYSPSSESYSYTNFIDLWKIIGKKWPLFFNLLPAEISSDKRRLEQSLLKLNLLRNSVMHPVKQISISKNDAEFMQQFRTEIDPTKWRWDSK